MSEYEEWRSVTRILYDNNDDDYNIDGNSMKALNGTIYSLWLQYQKAYLKLDYFFEPMDQNRFSIGG